MRILFDSKQLSYKDPFGTLTPGEVCRLNIRIPASVGTVKAVCRLSYEDGAFCRDVFLHPTATEEAYEVWSGEFSLEHTALYFYHFVIFNAEGSFRLFKQGDDTNMEAGDLWQVSCVPADFTTPDWAKGAVIYQVFPDRFCKVGSPDLAGKLEPYTVHERWSEELSWQPTADGKILNNDFYGGNFRGIASKLPYLKELGVGILYLNPIGKAFSSHRYDTGDYKVPDPMLGTLEDLRALCDKAHELGIRVILDGVYSHTGSNSRYFNKSGTFDGLGAYQSPDSPYRDWFTFYQYPNSYHCWWNFDTLPTVNKMAPSFMEYIITGEDSVVAHWLRQGADGFRLDVVDELPDEFVLLLKKRIRELKPDALLIGEVWEDASTKVAYGRRRRYFTDGELDSPMNYPFRTAIINFMRKLDDGKALKETVMSIVENYPPQVMHCTMNLLGTHDTPRILTALMDDFQGSRAEKAERRLTRSQMVTAMERLHCASFLQFMLPGAPAVYYGDEAGMEGYGDPFCRRTFPWGHEDRDLQAHYRRLGALRREQSALRMGSIRFLRAGNGQVGFERSHEGRTLRVYVNRSGDDWQVASGHILLGQNLASVSADRICIGHNGFCLLEV